MGRTKNLVEDLEYSKAIGRHGLDDHHWDAAIAMAKEVEQWEHHYQLKMENQLLIKTEKNGRTTQSVFRMDTRSTGHQLEANDSTILLGQSDDSAVKNPATEYLSQSNQRSNKRIN